MPRPTSSRPGPAGSRRRRWLTGAVTLLAALAMVAGLNGLAAPLASAGVARAAVAAHPAAGHTASAKHTHTTLKPVIRTAVRHDTSPRLRTMKPLKKLPGRKLGALPLRSPPHPIGRHVRTADVQRGNKVTTEDMPAFGANFEGVGDHGTDRRRDPLPGGHGSQSPRLGLTVTDLSRRGRLVQAAWRPRTGTSAGAAAGRLVPGVGSERTEEGWSW